MTRKSKRELERTVADVEDATGAHPPGGSSLDSEEREAIRALLAYRYAPYNDLPPEARDRRPTLGAALDAVRRHMPDEQVAALGGISFL